MKFAYLSLVSSFIIFIIFLLFNKKDKILQERIKNSLIDAVTFNSGLMLFLYLFGKVFSLAYFADLGEDSLLFAILIASVVLMSASADKYYSQIKNKINYFKRGRRKKNGKKH